MERKLHFDREIGRYCIGDRDLHCGNVFQIKVGEVWIRVHIEHDRAYPGGWYLIGPEDIRILPHRGMVVREGGR